MRVRIRVPLFKSPLIVYVGEETKETYRKEILKHFPDADPDNFAGGDGKQCGSWIWIKRAEVGLLAHELVHFADDCVAHLGIEDKNGEAEAYIVGWCMDNVWPKIKGDNP